MKSYRKSLTAIAAVLALSACTNSTSGENSSESEGLPGNRYGTTALASTEASDNALFTIPTMVNAWGIAIRPKGAGGHFWVGAGGTSFEFFGDVTASSDPALQKLTQDQLTEVTIPNADADTSDNSVGKATGVIFNPAPITSDLFVVKDQPVPVNGAEVHLTGSARFIFATDSGSISAWTEQMPDGLPLRANGPALEMFNGKSRGMQFFGIALHGDRLLAADFGADPQLRQFDKNWQLVPTVGFANPFATGDLIDPADPSKGKHVKPGDPAPFNVTTVGDRIFVTYAVTQRDEKDPKAFDAGEEDSLDKDQENAADQKPEKGKVVEFDATGQQVRVLEDEGRLNAPWGVAVAPEGFGPLSGMILVGNFGGNGHISAFDDTTGKFVDFVRGTDGKPLAIEGLWGLLFGNGESLGDANALYFAAGPEDEKHGLFGAIRATK